jgi:DNA-binding FadR family transcriptional regulator
MAALHADEDQRRQLQNRFDELERLKDDPASYVLADGDFHTEIAEMSGVAIARDLFTLIEVPLELARRGTVLIPGGMDAAHQQHAAICQRILAQDADGASAAMVEHLLSAQGRMEQLEWSGDRLILPKKRRD